jgi:hypothetical protein
MTTNPTFTTPEKLVIDETALRNIPLSWARALDTADASILEDLLTDDVVVDLTPATTKIGLDFPVLAGRENVIANMIGAVGPLDTLHMVSNVAVFAQGDGYRIEAYAMAQHFLPGEGPNPLLTRRALMGNRWTFLVTRDGGSLRVKHFEMDCVWFEGDPTVLLAAVLAQ